MSTNDTKAAVTLQRGMGKRISSQDKIAKSVFGIVNSGVSDRHAQLYTWKTTLMPPFGLIVCVNHEDLDKFVSLYIQLNIVISTSLISTWKSGLCFNMEI